jgi:S-formylglutathione hydrolase FrmB
MFSAVLAPLLGGAVLVVAASGCASHQSRTAGPGPDTRDIAAARAELEGAGVAVTDLGDGFLECVMESKALGRKELFSIHVPAGYSSNGAEPFPLSVFLHGRGRHHRSLIDPPATRAVLMRSPCVVLLPNGRDSWWVDSPIEPRSQYASYLEELIRLIDDSLHVSRDPLRRAMGGWSMGGFGSLNYLVSHPRDFGAWGGILALADFPNAAYPPEHNHSVPALFGGDPESFNPMRKADMLRDHALFFVTGTQAYDRRMNEALSTRLQALDVKHEFEVVPGAHTFDVVVTAFPRVMDFFSTHARQD